MTSLANSPPFSSPLGKRKGEFPPVQIHGDAASPRLEGRAERCGDAEI
jgi:hypothetical protein